MVKKINRLLIENRSASTVFSQLNSFLLYPDRHKVKMRV